MGREKFLERVWQWKEERFDHHLPAASRVMRLEPRALHHGWGLASSALYEQGLIYKDKRLVNWDPPVDRDFRP